MFIVSTFVSILQGQHSDVSDKDSAEEQDHDLDSDMERPVLADTTQRPRRSVQERVCATCLNFLLCSFR